MFKIEFWKILDKKAQGVFLEEFLSELRTASGTGSDSLFP